MLYVERHGRQHELLGTLCNMPWKRGRFFLFLFLFFARTFILTKSQRENYRNNAALENIYSSKWAFPEIFSLKHSISSSFYLKIIPLKIFLLAIFFHFGFKSKWFNTTSPRFISRLRFHSDIAANGCVNLNQKVLCLTFSTAKINWVKTLSD